MALRRDIRLRRRSDFDAVYRRGRIFNDPLLVLRTLPNEAGHNRYGFVTSKKLGGAVARNWLRRRLQEIVRLMPGGTGAAEAWSPEPHDIVISAKTAAAGASYQELEAAVRRLLVKSGLIAGDAEAGS